uniref:ABC transmembrane type-1 domain-containing protein n=1 Tax=Macrostomum lignano TaxID=282301 RepID=A0A1I8HYN6_9PLAT
MFLMSDKKEDGDKDAPKETVPMHRLFRYADGRDIFCIIAGSIFAAGHGCGWPLIAIIFGQMTNDFVKQDTLNTTSNTASSASWGDLSGFNFEESMSKYCLYYALIGVARVFRSHFQVMFWQIACERQAHRLRQNFFKAVLRQEMSWFDQQSSGELTTRLADDLERIREGLGDKTSVVIQAFSGFIAGFVIGFIKSWKMTLVMMSLTPLLAIGGALMGRLISTMTSREQKAYAKAGAVAEETVSCIRTVIAFCGQQDEEERYAKELEGSMKEGIKKSVIQGAGMGFVMFVLFSAYCLAFWFGATQVKEWQDTLGATGLPPGDIFTVFFCPTIDVDSETGDKPAHCTGQIELRDVAFKYPTRPDVPVLQGVSFTIQPGQTVALTGPSGCGKSSVVKLILRFYDPESGTVLIDGRDIRELNVHWYRSRIGLVSQEPVLFSGSIKKHPHGPGRRSQTRRWWQPASRPTRTSSSAGCQTVTTLWLASGAPSSAAARNSGVAIARALVRRPDILLLDEATSALDAESESVVQEALDKAGQGVTTLVIAHRLSTVRNADLILSINEGRVVEAGTHEQLLENRGLYYQLVSLQTFADDEQHRKNKKSSPRSNDEGVETDEDDKPAVGNGDLDKAVSNGHSKEANGVPDVTFELAAAGDSADKKRRASTASATRRDKEAEKAEQKALLAKAPGFFDILKMNSPEAGYIALACIGALLNGGGMPIFAVFFAEVIAVFSKVGDAMLQEATFWALMFLVLGGAQLLGNLFMNIGLGVAGERLTRRLRTMYFAAVLRQDMSYFDNPDNSVGAVTTRLANDASNAKGASGVRLAMPLQALFGVCLGLGIALYYGWMLALMIVGCVPFMAVAGFIHMAFQTKSQKATDKSSEMAGQTAAEAIENLPTVQSLCREPTFFKRYCDYLAGPYRKRLVGSVLSGVTYGFSEPLIDNLSNEGRRPDSVRGEIALEGVQFTYPQRPGVEVLHGLSLSFPAGQTVALVGVSGCGKSTVMALLQRFYDPSNGRVTLDGADLRDLNVSWLRRNIRVVSQEPVLFARSIEANIVYGLDSQQFVTHETVEAAAKQSNIHDFVSGLPSGYATEVGEKGAQLSGGQKQRVALARALVNRPKILLLDEATSALDTESEAVVQAALEEARQGRTCILIAHRLSTVQNADRIVVIEQGQVVEQGTHAELMRLGGAYYALASGAKKPGAAAADAPLVLDANAVVVNDNNNATPPPVDPPVHA